MVKQNKFFSHKYKHLLFFCLSALVFVKLLKFVVPTIKQNVFKCLGTNNNKTDSAYRLITISF